MLTAEIAIAEGCDVRELSDQFKISARSIGEVAEAVSGMVSRFRTTGEVKYRGRNLSREALINAAILYVDSLPHDQKVRAVNAGMERLEAMMRGDAPAETDITGKAKLTDHRAPKGGRKRTG